MFSRRDILKGSAVAALGATAPAVIAQQRPELKLSIDRNSPLYALREDAEADLGIRLTIQDEVYTERLRRIYLSPDTVDLFELRSKHAFSLMQSRAVQPIVLNQLERWAQIMPPLRDARTGQWLSTFGSPIASSLYTQPDGTLGGIPTERAVCLPLYLGFESFACLANDLPPGWNLAEASWNWLLRDESHGHIALPNVPESSYYALCLASMSLWPEAVADPSRPGEEELDRFFQRLRGFAGDGHFSLIWNRAPELVDSLDNRQTLISVISSEELYGIRTQHPSFRKLAPQEGFRCWMEGLFLSSAVPPRRRGAALAFMDWLIAGPAAAQITRHGYTATAPESARAHMPLSEWDYWYAGAPAQANLYNQAGSLIATPGDTLAEGSLQARADSVALWESDELALLGSLLENWGRLLRLV